MHALYPCSEDEERRLRAEPGLAPRTLRAGVEAALHWSRRQPHFAPAGELDPEIVERMLIRAKGSVERTKQRMDALYKLRGLYPELAQYGPAAGEPWDNFVYAPMPRMFEGQRVNVLQLCTTPDPARFQLEKLLRAGFQLADIRLRHDYMTGDIWILDFKNFSLNHLLRVNFITLSKAAQLLHGGYAPRVRALLVLNPPAPSVLQPLLASLRSIVRSVLLERITLLQRLEELQQHVPREHLPRDLGGDQPSLRDISENVQRELRSSETQQFLTHMSSLVSDESRREEGVGGWGGDGSFRKLDLD